VSFVLVSGVDVCGITRECDGSMVFRKGVHRHQVVLNIRGDDSVSYIQRHCRSVDLLVADVCDGVRCVSSCSCKAGATYWFGCAACVFEMRGMCARIEDVTRTLCGRVGYGVYGRGAMGSIVGYCHAFSTQRPTIQTDCALHLQLILHRAFALLRALPFKILPNLETDHSST